jgi:uncharacterized membrane protein YhfC
LLRLFPAAAVIFEERPRWIAVRIERHRHQAGADVVAAKIRGEIDELDGR